MPESNESLALLAQEGDLEAAGRLWEQNRGILFQLFSRYFPLCAKHRCEPDNLLQCGYFVILAAARAYDPGSGWKFTSYLKHHVQLAVAEVFCTRSTKQRPVEVSGSTPVGGEDGETELLNLMPDPGAEKAFEMAEEDVYTLQLHMALDKSMERLTERQRAIVSRRFYGGETYAAIAEDCGTTLGSVRQDQQRALQKMGRDRQLRAYRADIISRSAWRGGLGRFRDTGMSSVEWAVEYLEARGLLGEDIAPEV